MVCSLLEVFSKLVDNDVRGYSISSLIACGGLPKSFVIKIQNRCFVANLRCCMANYPLSFDWMNNGPNLCLSIINIKGGSECDMMRSHMKVWHAKLFFTRDWGQYHVAVGLWQEGSAWVSWLWCCCCFCWLRIFHSILINTLTHKQTIYAHVPQRTKQIKLTTDMIHVYDKDQRM